MNPSRMKQFLVEERCVYAGNLVLPTIPDFLSWCEAKRAFRIIRKAERKPAEQAQCRGVPVGA